MDRLVIVRRRLHEQRLAGDPFEGPAEAVAWFGAVQAQEFAEAKWSLGERVRDCTDADVEDAFARGEILRTTCCGRRGTSSPRPISAGCCA
jgi:hypothetical protein